MIRKAKPSDIPAIVDIAVESVSQNPLPVKIDREAIAQMIQFCLNPAHFGYVIEDDGVVVAAMGAISQRSFWYKGLQVSVLLYYTRKPGAGILLMREFARWVKSRSGIKTAVIELEPDVDERLVSFLSKAGFGRKTINMTYVREPGGQS
ncbi:GNAT family N-acetyltransferase [Marinobacterium sp. MBR-109]|jgi:hypothetical protein|uniref:GNAT family N-acetyltransferase n=1 Tax=Marinobacterium sp. MBR-109 TaxID=3156462 RepID=UPI00339491B7